MRRDDKGASLLPSVPWRIDHAHPLARAERAAADGVAFAKAQAVLRDELRAWRRAPDPVPVGPRGIGDGGSRGFARGALDLELVVSNEFDALGRPVTSSSRVVRRAESPALCGLPDASRQAARVYAALSEQARSIRAPSDGPRSGVGDGGAAARCDTASRLRSCEGVIGTAVVLEARGTAAQADRGRRTLRVRDVIDGVALDGLGASPLLVRWGWSRGPANVRALQAALAEGLDRLAVHLGLAAKGG